MSKIDEICKYLDAKFSSDGKIQSDIKELFVYRASVPTEFLTGVYEPALCMVFKGSKLAKVGNDFYEYDELLEAVFKFIRLLERPNDAKFLAKLAIKEILYILLKGENGDFLRQYAMLETIENRVTRAAKEIKSNYAEAINIENLAKKLGISASSLYHNFKRITALSPLQFQKKIRLEKAKNLLINQNLDAAEAAFAVGYASPSQFNREYSKMFGMPPKAHVLAITGA